MNATRFIWLHGFASSPQSSKGRFIRARLAERGVWLEVPDLNEPSFREMTVTRMLGQIDALADAPVRRDRARGSGGDAPPQVVIFGSSLGGFAAATWAATRIGRAAAVVLLAPAFDLANRWEAEMRPDDLARWQREGEFPFEHYAWGRTEMLGRAFADDARALAPFPLPDAPTLVIQGVRDTVVQPALAREFTRRMEAAQKQVRLVELDDGHELTKDLPRLWTEIAREIEPHLAPISQTAPIANRAPSSG